MSDQGYRLERDSMGDMRVPTSAEYGAQTQRAVENFNISGQRLPPSFLQALARVKQAAAMANLELGELDEARSQAIQQAAASVAEDLPLDQFPVDIFQTGSGTSSNMNMNEVLAHRANALCGEEVHPNDHVNMGQSSNDVIPTTIHVSAALALKTDLLPALSNARQVIENKASSLETVVKTGRTHLMDAMPLTMAQELTGWSMQLATVERQLKETLPIISQLAQGGTAIGTGINAHPAFATTFCRQLAAICNHEFEPADNFFASISGQEAACSLSGQLKTLACALMKIANDLRWMNSGPLAGLGEIALPALQPGSSIMPGKVNPVIPEAVTMACAQVIGNDACITVAAQSGSFQLNVMLPVIAQNLLQSLQLMTASLNALADKAVDGFEVQESKLQVALARNPILVTALNPVIGYSKAAKIAKLAYQEQAPIKEVALRETDLDEDTLDRLLNPRALTEGGIAK